MAGSAKRSGSRGSAGVLFSLVHLLLELLGLLLVDETERCETFLQFECVEKGSVLVIAPRIEDLLIPNDPAVGWRNIYQFEPVGVADQIVGQHNGALQSRVGPFRAIGIRNIELGDGNGLDFVGLLGHEALDGILVVVVEDRGHVCGGGGRSGAVAGAKARRRRMVAGRKKRRRIR